MSSLAQIEANRRNALKSTGPKTPEGKAIASRNAITHGLSARMPVIPGENEAEFAAYTERWLDELEPIGPMEEHLTERIISIAWRLRRVGQIEANLFKPNESQETSQLSRLNRYENALERSYYRAVAELKALQKERRAPKPEFYGPEDYEDYPVQPVVIEKRGWVFLPPPPAGDGGRQECLPYKAPAPV